MNKFNKNRWYLITKLIYIITLECFLFTQISYALIVDPKLSPFDMRGRNSFGPSLAPFSHPAFPVSDSSIPVVANSSPISLNQIKPPETTELTKKDIKDLSAIYLFIGKYIGTKGYNLAYSDLSPEEKQKVDEWQKNYLEPWQARGYKEEEIKAELAIRIHIRAEVFPNKETLSPEEFKFVEDWASLVKGGLRDLSLAQVSGDGIIFTKTDTEYAQFTQKGKDIELKYKFPSSKGSISLMFQIKKEFQDLNLTKFKILTLKVRGIDNKDYNNKEIFMNLYDEDGNTIRTSVVIEEINEGWNIPIDDLVKNYKDFGNIVAVKIYMDAGSDPLEGIIRFEDIAFTSQEDDIGVLDLAKIKDLINLSQEPEIKKFLGKIRMREFNPLQDKDFLVYLNRLAEVKGRDGVKEILNTWAEISPLAEEFLARPLFTRNLPGWGYYWNIKDEAILGMFAQLVKELQRSGKVATSREAMEEIKKSIASFSEFTKSVASDILKRPLDFNLVGDVELLSLFKTLGINIKDLQKRIYGDPVTPGLLSQTKTIADTVLMDLIKQEKRENVKAYLEYMRTNLQEKNTGFDLFLKYGVIHLTKGKNLEGVKTALKALIQKSFEKVGSGNLSQEQLTVYLNQKLSDEFFTLYKLDAKSMQDVFRQMLEKGVYKDEALDQKYYAVIKEIDDMFTLAVVLELQKQSEKISGILQSWVEKKEISDALKEVRENFLKEEKDILSVFNFWDKEYIEGKEGLLAKSNELKSKYPQHASSGGFIERKLVQLMLEAYLERPLDLGSPTEQWILDYWNTALSSKIFASPSDLAREFSQRKDASPQRVKGEYPMYHVDLLKTLFDNIVVSPGEKIEDSAFLFDWRGGPLDVILDTLYGWKSFRNDVEKGVNGGRLLALGDMRDRPLLNYFVAKGANEPVRKFIADKMKFNPYFQAGLNTRTDLGASIKEAGYSSFYVELKQKGFSDDEIKRILTTLGDIREPLSELYGKPKFDYKNMNDREFLEQMLKKVFDYALATVDQETFISQDALRGIGTSTGVTGFIMSMLPVGVELGWIGREKAKELAIKTIKTFLGNLNDPNGPYAQTILGEDYHYYEGKTAQRETDNEVSTIDGSLKILSALTNGEYFEGEVKELALELFSRTRYRVFQNLNDRIRNQKAGGSPLPGLTMTMGYKPEQGFLYFPWNMYSGESIIIYLLAMASPRYGLLDPKKSWEDGFSRMGAKEGGIPNTDFGFFMMNDPEGTLFTHQYAHAWFDFLNKTDSLGIDYWRNSVLATLNNVFYGVLNSPLFRTYGLNSWGITSMGRPERYTMDFGIPPTKDQVPEHDSTISASGPGGSIVFTPKYAIDALRFMGLAIPQAWGEFGPKDSYNLDRNFFSPTYFGLGEGVTGLMLANFLYPGLGLTQEQKARGEKGKGLIWNIFMRNENIKKAMESKEEGAGFEDKKDITPVIQISKELSDSFRNSLSTIESNLDALLKKTDINIILDNYKGIVSKAKTEGDFKKLIELLMNRTESPLRNLLIAKVRMDEVENISVAAKTDLEAGRYFVDWNDVYYAQAREFLDKVVADSEANIVMKTAATALLAVNYKKDWMYAEQKEAFKNLNSLTKDNNGLKELVSSIIVHYFEEELVSLLYAQDARTEMGKDRSTKELNYKKYVMLSLYMDGVLSDAELEKAKAASKINDEDFNNFKEAKKNGDKSIALNFLANLINYVKEAIDNYAQNEFFTIPWLENYLSQNRKIDDFEPKQSGVTGYYASLLVTQGFTKDEVLALIEDMKLVKGEVFENKTRLGRVLDLWGSAQDVGLLSFAVQLYREGYNYDQIASMLKGDAVALENDLLKNLEEVAKARNKVVLPSISEAKTLLSQQDVEKIVGQKIDTRNAADINLWQDLAYLVKQGLNVNDLVALKAKINDLGLGGKPLELNLKDASYLKYFFDWGRLYAGVKKIDTKFILDNPGLGILSKLVEAADKTSGLKIESPQDLAGKVNQGVFNINRTVDFLQDMYLLKQDLDSLYDGGLKLTEPRHLEIMVSWTTKRSRGYSISDLKEKIKLFGQLKGKIAEAYRNNGISFDILTQDVNRGALKEWAELAEDLISKKDIDLRIIGRIVKELPKIEIVTSSDFIGDAGDKNVAFMSTQGRFLRYQKLVETDLDFQNRTLADETLKILTVAYILQELKFDLKIGLEVEIKDGIPLKIKNTLGASDSDIELFTRLIYRLEEEGYFDKGHFGMHPQDLKNWQDLGVPEIRKFLEEYKDNKDKLATELLGYRTSEKIIADVKANIEEAGKNIQRFLKENVLGRDLDKDKDKAIFEDWLGLRFPEVEEIKHSLLDWKEITDKPELIAEIKAWADAIVAKPLQFNISVTQDLLEKAELLDLYADYVGRPDLKAKTIEEIRDTDMISFSNLSYWRDQINPDKFITLETVKMMLGIRTDLKNNLINLYGRNIKPNDFNDTGIIGFFVVGVEGASLRFGSLIEGLLNTNIGSQKLMDEFTSNFTSNLIKALNAKDAEALKGYLINSLKLDSAQAQEAASSWFNYTKELVSLLQADNPTLTREIVVNKVIKPELDLVFKLMQLAKEGKKEALAEELAKYRGLKKEEMAKETELWIQQIEALKQSFLSGLSYKIEKTKLENKALAQVVSSLFGKQIALKRIELMSKVRPKVEKVLDRKLDLNNLLDMGILGFYATKELYLIK